MKCESGKVNPKLLLCGALGHLLCWFGGDLLLYFLPNGRLNVMDLFDYEKTATMLQGASPLQFTISGIVGVIAMILIMPGYFQIANILKQAHEIMLSYFFETCVTSGMCNVGVFMVCITLFLGVIRKKTCFPKWACLINTITFTMVAGILFAGMGAMNVGSSLMFLGLYFLMKKYSKRVV